MTRTRIGLAIVGLTILIALFGPLFAPHSPTEVRGVPNSKPSGTALFGADARPRRVEPLLARRQDGAVDGRGGHGVRHRRRNRRRAGGRLFARLARRRAHARQRRAAGLPRSCSSCSPSPRWARAVADRVDGRTHPRGRASCAARRSRWSSGTSSRRPRRWARRRADRVRQLLPNVEPLLVETGLRMTYSIGLVAAISFLGFGLQPPADWGLMINENRLAITVQPWGVLLQVAASVCLRWGPTW